MAIERSILHREGDPPDTTTPSESTRPPPYNPHFPSENQNSDSTMTESHSEVGWNRDLFDDEPNTQSRPLGFDGVQSGPDSIPAQSTGTMGTGVRQRWNQSSGEPSPPGESRREVEERQTSSLTRQEIREARLLRLGGRGGERKPLSELSGHTFKFRK